MLGLLENLSISSITNLVIGDVFGDDFLLNMIDIISSRMNNLTIGITRSIDFSWSTLSIGYTSLTCLYSTLNSLIMTIATTWWSIGITYISSNYISYNRFSLNYFYSSFSYNWGFMNNCDWFSSLLDFLRLLPFIISL